MSVRLRWIALLLVLCALTLASYEPAFEADFVHFDDTGYIQTNPPVATGLSLENLRWALTGVRLSNWHPITWISHMIDVELFGFDPRGHHAENIALHLLNIVLLFAVLRALTNDAVPSFVVAALFAVHPANVESVAWVAQRKTLLCALFALLSIRSYARYARGGGRIPYTASLGWLALSLLSKPMFVTLPFALLLLDYWPLRRSAFALAPDGRATLRGLLRGWLRLLPEKIPFAVLCVAVAAITIDAQQDSMSTIESYTIVERLGNVALAYVKYLGIFFAPRHLAVFYPLLPEQLTLRIVLACVALLVMITSSAVWLGLRRGYLLVGWFWFVGTLIPVIGLVQVGMQSMADRYVYVPFWGLAIAFAWSARDLLSARLPALAARALGATALALLLCGLALLTWRQTGKWHDGIRLFESAIANTEHNWIAHGVLAERYYALGNFQKTIEHCREAVKYNRDLGTIHSTYGLALFETGEPEQALAHFELATQQEPSNPVGSMNLGWFYIERGQYDVAIEHLRIAAERIGRTTPIYTRKMIYANWASALAKSNQLAASRKMYARALEVEPKSPDLLRDAARIDLQLGNAEGAAAGLRRALEIDAADLDASYLLASATLLLGLTDESAALLQRASTQDARKAVVAIDLARSLARQNRRDDAFRIVDALLALAPPTDPADARFVASALHTQRAEIALEAGDVAGAIASLDRAVALWPDDYDANNRLAFLLATSTDSRLRDPVRAVALAERAVGARREFGSLATLAAAYAAAGRLPDAVAAATEGQELATRANDARAVAALEQQRRLYSEAEARISDAPK